VCDQRAAESLQGELPGRLGDDAIFDRGVRSLGQAMSSGG
jgi:hypothetical protein